MLTKGHLAWRNESVTTKECDRRPTLRDLKRVVKSELTAEQERDLEQWVAQVEAASKATVQTLEGDELSVNPALIGKTDREHEPLPLDLESDEESSAQECETSENATLAGVYLMMTRMTLMTRGRM